MPRDPGRVLLVGAGPGAADLLTVRAARAVSEAQALLYDALVPQEILDLAPVNCLKIQTGKRAGGTSMAQPTINRLMVRLARRGLDVVRLKGGDPSVFGRVGEEMAALQAAGIEAQVIPGVTAAAAAAAQFGFPLTHRGRARRVVLTTARLDQGGLVEDWRAAADPEATLAIYMGGASAGAIRDRLLAAGRSAATPVLAVENAGRDEARLFTGVLGGLAETVPGDLDGPVLIVVGEVAAQAIQTALPALTGLAS
ncbi:uroporphyrinogen-III C-methyltransferase [Phenylobacterium sp. 58.2.17]|uniref:uroporphyrinogen-III C-methyltransferase n=1 Tax=Phenylobacterium sp. 58.2.17 TaxID=2969306 RepID=UPI00226554BE|nr:uroporphyrinogen-III C-methyltransferase [Phenylobacterium sp. 58.2.17]MCX7585339.1 uroporphyrinogen-III C-methyltransferase [Phenylobacterium sp. 58.2.17]